MKPNYQFFLLLIATNFVINIAFPQADSLKTNKKRKLNFEIQLDQRNSFLGDASFPVNINGLNVGWNHHQKYRIGFGIYLILATRPDAYLVDANAKLREAVPNATVLTKNGSRVFLVESENKIYYFTPSFQYKIYNSKWLEIDIPLEVGVGYSEKVVSEYFSGTEIPTLSKKNGAILAAKNIFFPVSAGALFSLKLSPDVGLFASAGYRFIVKEIGVSENFDGLYYQYGLRLFPFRILENIKKDFLNRKMKWKAEK
jgi:hypothetical protein